MADHRVAITERDKAALVRYVLAAILGLYGALALLLGMMGLVNEHRSKTWPSTNGTITHSEMEHRVWEGRRRMTRYRVKPTYEYIVDGEHYSSGRLDLANLWEKRDVAQEHAKLYSVGTKVKVYYKPGSPNIALLEPGVGSGIGVLAQGAVLMLIALILGLYSKIKAAVTTPKRLPRRRRKKD